ncbi:cadherin-related family member 5 isoform X1 [Spea bombifrons]|uniref:cadherin-related family member 5 isoform X1 n=1 Tax=Spea bombifrons TaxID=233779 RepID=UPI00234A7F9D|nr:cadherin-related family member 5 isoform X1 [Spea bombifrons]
MGSMLALFVLLLIPLQCLAQGCRVENDQVHVSENNNPGYIVTGITADPGYAVSISTNGAHSAFFKILGNDLILNKSIDYEEGPTVLIVQLLCTKDNVIVNTIPVTVIIINENDNAPEFKDTQFNFSIPEDISVNSAIGSAIEATDADNDPIFYELRNTSMMESEYFRLTSINNPVILVKKSLDYDLHKNMQLLLLARDTNDPGVNGSHTATATINIAIQDVDNLPPQFRPCTDIGNKICISGGYKSSVNRSEQATGALIFSPGPIYAVDGDVSFNTVILYNIVSGNDENIFSMDSNSGNITMLKKADQLGTILLQIMAFQENDPLQYAITTVQIEVKEKNSYPPTFVKSSYFGQIQAFSEIGNFVIDLSSPNKPLQVFATDKDFPNELNPSIIYKIENNNNFTISRDGYIITNTELLSPTSIEFLVIAIDSVTNDEDKTTVTVEVTPVLTTPVTTTASLWTTTSIGSDTSILTNPGPNNTITTSSGTGTSTSSNPGTGTTTSTTPGTGTTTSTTPGTGTTTSTTPGTGTTTPATPGTGTTTSATPGTGTTTSTTPGTGTTTPATPGTGTTTSTTPGTGTTTPATPGTGTTTSTTPGTGTTTPATPGTGTTTTATLGTGTTMTTTTPRTGTTMTTTPGTGTTMTTTPGTGTTMTTTPGTGTTMTTTPGTGTTTRTIPKTDITSTTTPGTGSTMTTTPKTGITTNTTHASGTITTITTTPNTGTITNITPVTGTGTTTTPGTGTAMKTTSGRDSTTSATHGTGTTTTSTQVSDTTMTRTGTSTSPGAGTTINITPGAGVGSSSNKIYSVRDMAAVGASLGAVLAVCLAGLGFLIYKQYGDKLRTKFRKGYGKDFGSSGDDESGNNSGSTTGTPNNLNDDLDGPLVDTLSNSNLTTAPLATSIAISGSLADFGETDTTDSISDPDDKKEVKSILTKEFKEDAGYKSVWFREDAAPEVVVIEGTEEGEADDEEEEEYNNREDDDDDDDVPRPTFSTQENNVNITIL